MGCNDCYDDGKLETDKRNLRATTALKKLDWINLSKLTVIELKTVLYSPYFGDYPEHVVKELERIAYETS